MTVCVPPEQYRPRLRQAARTLPASVGRAATTKPKNQCANIANMNKMRKKLKKLFKI